MCNSHEKGSAHFAEEMANEEQQLEHIDIEDEPLKKYHAENLAAKTQG